MADWPPPPPHENASIPPPQQMRIGYFPVYYPYVYTTQTLPDDPYFLNTHPSLIHSAHYPYHSPHLSGGAAAGHHTEETAEGHPKTDFDLGGNTTVMLKNIPNRLIRDALMSTLNKICYDQNQHSDTYCAYDFLYLPFDFSTEKNKGYSFVNFTTKEGAVKVCGILHGKAWKYSKKICDVSPADSQGKRNLIKRFKDMSFKCCEYQPIFLKPPCDGSNTTQSKISLIGSV